MFGFKTPQERIYKIESLIKDAGLLEELEQKVDAANDKRRAALAQQLSTLPDRAKTLAAAGKAERVAHSEYERAREGYLKAQDAWSAAIGDLHAATYAVDSTRARIVRDLEQTAPEELRGAARDLGTLDECLRACAGIVAMERRYGTPGYDAVSNLDSVSSARAIVASAASEIKDMMLDGRTESSRLIARVEEKMVAVGIAVSGFVHQNLWNQRHSKSPADMIRETTRVI